MGTAPNSSSFRMLGPIIQARNFSCATYDYLDAHALRELHVGGQMGG